MTSLLVSAGVACILAAIAHGYLGQTRLIAPAAFAGRQAKALVVLIWQFSAAAWAACGAVIAASPWLFSDATRPAAVAIACLPLLWGVVGNAWITRGRHFGWKLFGAIVLVAAIGAAI
jgi:hypothetical protein